MGNYSREQVMEVIASVMQKANETTSVPLKTIHEELQVLASVIDNMHSEIIDSRGHDVGGKHIPNATDELDAVIGATEEASATIMDACDAIQAHADNMSDESLKSGIYDETTKIFEACSFQDITGQRISKVVKTLKEIEKSVDKLLSVFGTSEGLILPESLDSRSEDEKLKNGPQLKGKGVSQDDIDKLLAEFG